MREVTFDFLLKSSTLKRYVYYAYIKSPFFFKFLIHLIYSLYCIGLIPRTNEIVEDSLFWTREPERQAIKSLELHPRLREIKIAFKFKRLLVNTLSMRRSILSRYIKLILNESKKEVSYHTLRGLELILFFFYSSRYNSTKLKCFFSSDSSPESLGIMLGWRGQTIYSPHGILPYSDRRLFFDNCYVTNKFNFNLLNKKVTGSIELIEKKPVTEINIRQIPQHKNKIKVGIIIPLIPNNEGIQKYIKLLQKKFLNIIFVIKKHPNQIIALNQEVLSMTSEKLNLNDCDFVLSGNSGHMIKVIYNLVPVIYCKELDFVSNDIYRLVKNNLIITWETSDTCNPGLINEFYKSKVWSNHFIKNI